MSMKRNASFGSYLRSLLACLWPLLLTGCAAPVYQLTPETGEVAWIEGRPTTRAERGGLTLVASYERLDLDYVALDIEVKNRTDRSVDINPADFRYAALNPVHDTLRSPSTGTRLAYFAADPTREADRVSAYQEREVKRLKRARILNTVLLVAAVASDVASSTSRKNASADRWVRNRVTHDNLYTAIQAKRMIDHGTFADRMQRYDYEAYRWRELALKRTTVAPGESVRGLVYLPLNKDASYLLVSYSVPETEPVAIRFRQEWVKQGRGSRP